MKLLCRMRLHQMIYSFVTVRDADDKIIGMSRHGVCIAGCGRKVHALRFNPEEPWKDHP